MITTQVLPILQVILILLAQRIRCYPSPVYGTKRYGRSTAHKVSTDPYGPYVRTYPINYYSFYPVYSQAYPEDYYYPQESYPLSYPSARTSKYEVYQAVLPYYYKETPVASHKYDYYGYADPSSVDMQERLIQDIDREQRERSQPIGHEIRYENDYSSDDQGVDAINAAFIKNLAASDMYDDSPSGRMYYDPTPYDYEDANSVINHGKLDDLPYDRPLSKEDEDVRELKELTKQNKKQKQRKQNNKIDSGVHWLQDPSYRDQYDVPSKRNEIDEAVVYTDRKPVVKDVTTTQVPLVTTVAPKRDARGQKEEVLMRPATPVRHPFSNSVLEMISSQNDDRKRSPSVYDTIKHMLEMEKSYEEKQTGNELRPLMRKRIVSNEDSLTKQLSVLKKVH